jgi:EmrB/QacA subfamily drug resistance transporter
MPSSVSDNASASLLPSELVTSVDVRRVRLVFAGLVVAMLLASLDQTIISTALPTIVADLDGVTEMGWIITAYTLAATIVMPIYGRLGDLIGRKPIFLAAIVVFLVGSLIGGLATAMPALITGRFVQGFGGGGLIITAQALIADVVPPRQRGRYLGLMSGVFAISSVAGPLLGGYFTEVAGWRWCFWINLPLGEAALLVAALALPPAHPGTSRPRLDWGGMALMALAVTSLVLLSGWGGSTYDWTSPQISGLGVLTVVAGGLFVVVERRALEPLIPLTLLRNRTFVLATTAGLLLAVAMFAAISYLPTFLQKVQGYSPSTAGLLMLALMAGLLVASTASGQLIARTGRYLRYPVVGLLLTAAALLLMPSFTVTTPTVLVCCYLALLGVGIGLTLQVLVLVVQNAADHRVVGTVTAANNFFREIGASLGIALVGTLFTSRLSTHLAAGQPEPQAYADALTPILGWLAPLCLVALLLIAALPPNPLKTSNDTSTPGTPPALPPTT